MKILAIVGSRDYSNMEEFNARVYDWIENNGKPSGIVSGGAKGADSMAEDFAEREEIPIEIHRPDWNTHGRAAGMIRNSDIVNSCTHMLAFPSKKGKGTQDSIKKAKNLGKVVETHYVD